MNDGMVIVLLKFWFNVNGPHYLFKNVLTALVNDINM